MIESIQVSNVATYGQEQQVMGGLSKFNFIFGSNGSGKTTLSRIIADSIAHPSCSISWRAGTKLQTLVYNRDFVNRNFNQGSELNGIFTLGEKNVETLEKIEITRRELEIITKKVEALTNTLSGVDEKGGKKRDLADLDEQFRTKCWAAYTKHKGKLGHAFEGFRNSKDSFRDKVVSESKANIATLQSLDMLESRADAILGTTPAAELAVATIDAASLLNAETSPILKKRVIGSGDVDIAAMITKLGNSDWVRAGRPFFAMNDSTCPFCQQKTDAAFAESLVQYFNEAFEADTHALDVVMTNYSTDASRIQNAVEAAMNSASRFLDSEKLRAEKALLDARILVNMQRLAEKKKEPSQIVELESLANVASAVSDLITEANLKISEHNKVVANLAKERRDLVAQVWKYLLEVDLKTDLSTYTLNRNELDKAIQGLNNGIAAVILEKSNKLAELRSLEKETTSIQPTLDTVNALLMSFGFRGFSLAKAESGPRYKLIRQDGRDAKETLSEGERTFITFLYFYHLLRGSDTETGVTSNRVVVFDDPVSSLDSDILFIVSSLIRGLFEEVRANTGNVKQIFVLTHNVYFHKEVSFNPDRKQDKAMKEETFWIVRKPELTSVVHNHESNPIKTSYDLLWAEVRGPVRSNLTLQNTLRRILENYFKILGGIDQNKICARFEGKDRLICKSLFSWINDGSHFAHDDLYVSVPDQEIEKYLIVFRSIFETMEHGAHYKMMMGAAYKETVEAELV